MKVVVLTTSYPRNPRDTAGRFVADAVGAVRAQGVSVEVVSPASFPHFGLAFGDGLVQNLRAAPWRAAFAPAFLAAFARAARRAARDADLVHAHWIPAALAARATGKPYVLQVWGTDVDLARRAPAIARPLVRGARVVVAASGFLADAAKDLGARAVEVVPAGVRVPADVPEPDEPPHVLFAGRLSPEKGIEEFVVATEGLQRRIAGDGPLRARVPEAAGFVPPGEIGAWFGRAALVCVPSRREGYGVVAREALAWGRPVVTTGVGGLRDLSEGVRAVPPGDVVALRAAVVALLEDRAERRRLGAAGRAYALERLSLDREAVGLIGAYHQALHA